MDHFAKSLHFSTACRVSVRDGLSLQFLHGMQYRSNVSIRRLMNHAQLGRQFRLLVRSEKPPEVIICSFPTIELAYEAVRYAEEKAIPIVIDIRDLWPDIFIDAIPTVLRPFGRIALAPLQRKAIHALRNCTRLCAVSPGYLQWAATKAARKLTDQDRVFPLGYERIAVGAGERAAILEKFGRLGIDERKTIAVFAGTFGHSYDLATVIGAARALEHRRAADVLFVLCGDGERGPEWRQLSAGLRTVVFTGWLTANELAVLLSLSSVGLAAYAGGAAQGLPNKVIEYMSAGLPIISSLRGEAGELIESLGCGTLYSAGDADGLAAIVEEYGSSIDRRQGQGARALAYFESHFAAKEVFDSMRNWLVEFGGALAPQE